MTVENQFPYQSFTANGSQTNFALGFYVDDKDHFEVKKNDQAVNKNEYSYDKSSNSILFNITPNQGEAIEIHRSTSADRATNYATYNNSFRPEVLNKDIDRIWLKIQELGVADTLLKIYINKLDADQKSYIDTQDQAIKQIVADLRNYVDTQDNSLTGSINNLKNYVDTQDNALSTNISNLRAYVDSQDQNLNRDFTNLIQKQGVSLQQLNSYYNNLMQRIAAIAVDKGWEASFVVDSKTGRTQSEKNSDVISAKDFGAIGDNTLHTVQEWIGAGKYKNLSDIKKDYPHVTSLTDSIDWAAIQKALDTGKHVVGPIGNYRINKSLYMQTGKQHLKDLGSIWMDATLGKPCIYIGAKDSTGTKSESSVWQARIDGISFCGQGNRTQGSSGVNLVWCSQGIFTFEARGFFAGLEITGLSIVNTFNTLTLLQNTYGVYDVVGNPTLADIQASIFIGGRIEQNQREGVYTSSPNIKFNGTVIEGNGLWDSGDGTTAEVALLGGTTSGSVNFSDCYMESLAGKSIDSIIQIKSGASRTLFINGGEYYGSLDKNKYLVKIENPASNVVGVLITGASVNDVLNYAKGVISGNSRVSVMNCFPREEMALWLDVTVGVGSPLIQQIDRSYWYVNQNLRTKQISNADEISSVGNITTSGQLFSQYTHSKSPVIGRVEFDNFLQTRQKINTVVTATVPLIDAIEIVSDLNYVFEIEALGRSSKFNTHAFTARLVINKPSGNTEIQNAQVLYNSKPDQTLEFSVDSEGNIVVHSTSGDSLNKCIYRIFKKRLMTI